MDCRDYMGRAGAKGVMKSLSNAGLGSSSGRRRMKGSGGLGHRGRVGATGIKEEPIEHGVWS